MTATVKQLSDNNTSGTVLGQSATDLIGHYGVAPVAQRTSSVQATTNLATSSAFGATQLAAVQEIMNTLAGLGLWKGA